MPSVAFARSYSGGRSYHSSYSSHSFGSSSSGRSYSSGSTFGLPKTGSPSTGTYRSSTKSYSGGSTYRSNKSTTRTTTTRTTRSSFGGSYGYGASGYGFYPGHFGSFVSGFFLGSLFHPFGWGFGGPYYGGGPGYFTSGGWGGPGYSPFWSVIGIMVDIIVLLLLIKLIVAIGRTVARRRRSTYERPGYRRGHDPMYDDDYIDETIERTETVEIVKTVATLDEQAVCDACCEYVARVRHCDPSDVTVDLLYDYAGRFGADIWVRGTVAPSLGDAELREAVAAFVADREHVTRGRVSVNLKFEPGLGVHAEAEVL